MLDEYRNTEALSYEIVLATDDALIAQCKAVRMAVFVEEQGFPAAVEFDQYVSRSPMPLTDHEFS